MLKPGIESLLQTLGGGLEKYLILIIFSFASEVKNGQVTFAENQKIENDQLSKK